MLQHTDILAIDKFLIARVVERFYDRVRSDSILGPIFEDRIHDWPRHLALLERFWASVMLRTGEYKGTPLMAHMALPGLTAEHFDHWLMLFGETVDAECTAPQAAAFRFRASRIAQSLQMAVLPQAL